MMSTNEQDKDKKQAESSKKKPYDFGGIKQFDLQQIEQEVLNDSVYLDVFAGSDPAFKEEVHQLNHLDTVALLDLNVYRYRYATDKFQDKNFPQGQRLGLMADEVEKAFPECVQTDKEGYRYVNYAMLVAPLIETVKHLEAKVAELEKKIAEK